MSEQKVTSNGVSLNRNLESLLLVATRPLSLKKLVEQTNVTVKDVEQAIGELKQKYNHDASGIQILEHGSTVQFVTSPMASKLVTEYLKEEQAGELTRPALETLTIIAYRGPISKIQLDTIRGVNCSLILRNLMIKGLVEAKSAKDKYQTTYTVSSDFIRFLGLTDITQLPDYEQLHVDERLEQILNPTAPVTVAEDHLAQPAS
jgi:segregation and condensation protein B